MWRETSILERSKAWALLLSPPTSRKWFIGILSGLIFLLPSSGLLCCSQVYPVVWTLSRVFGRGDWNVWGAENKWTGTVTSYFFHDLPLDWITSPLPFPSGKEVSLLTTILTSPFLGIVKFTILWTRNDFQLSLLLYCIFGCTDSTRPLWWESSHGQYINK